MKYSLWSLKLVTTIQYSGIITISSHTQPAVPPIQFIRISLRPSGTPPPPPPDFLCAVAPVVLVTTAMSHSLHLAGRRAAAEPAEQQRQEQAEHDDDDRDHTGQSHLVAHEPLLVHEQREHPGGVAGSTGGQHEDQVEERQRSDDHQLRRRDDGVLQLRHGDAEELPYPSRAIDLGRLVHRRRDLPDAALVDKRVERDELPGHDEDDHGDGETGIAEPVL